MNRAFGVLHVHFDIIRGPAQYLDRDDWALIMKACAMLHNMIIQDDRDSYNVMPPILITIF